MSTSNTLKDAHELSELDLYQSHFEIPLRFKDGTRLDSCPLPIPADRLAEYNSILEHASFQLGNLLARKLIHSRLGSSPPVFPPYNRSDPAQQPLKFRASPTSANSSMIINRKHIYYPRWVQIRARCYNPSCPAFHHRYGSRKITGDWMALDFIGHRVLQENRVAFFQFVASLEIAGRRPFADYTIDRIKVNAGYQLGNMRWASPKTQALNQGDPQFYVPFLFSNPNFHKVAAQILRKGKRSSKSQSYMRLSLRTLMSASFKL